MRSGSTRAAGLLILILGIWGGLVPFVGPYFHFALGSTKSWTWTTDRFWLDVLPGIVAVLGGLLLLGAGPRPAGKFGALLALAAGIWFVIGPDVSLLWKAAGAEGAAHGAKFVRVLELLSYHTLVGVLIAGLAGYALAGPVTRRAEAEVEAAEAGTAAAPAVATAPARRPVTPPRATTPAAAPTAAGDHTVATQQLPSVREEAEPAAPREPVAAQADTAPAPKPAEPAAEPEQPATEPEPVVRESPTPDAHAAEPATAVIDRSAGRDPDATATGDTQAADPPPADPPPAASAAGAGSGAPVTVRRRQGGLLSRLRR